MTGTTSAVVANGDNITSSCYIVNNQNYCFYTNGSLLSWDEAREFCATKNSTLPIITDENIDNVFQQFIVDNGTYNMIRNRYVWIGVHALPVNRNTPWHWINGRQSRLFDLFFLLPPALGLARAEKYCIICPGFLFLFKALSPTSVNQHFPNFPR